MSYEQDQAAIERRRRLAEIMMAQGQQQEPMQMAGGLVVPATPLNALSKIAHQLSGAYIANRAEKQAKQLEDERYSKLAGINFSSPDAMNQLAQFDPKLAVDMAMKRAQTEQPRQGTPGSGYVPAGYTFEAGTDGIPSGWKGPQGDFIPYPREMTQYQARSLDPRVQAELTQAREQNKIFSYTDPEGRPMHGTGAEVTGQRPLGGGTYATAPDGSIDWSALLPSMTNVESGGNVNAISSAGAVGPLQVKPSTGAQPGGNVPPLKSNSLSDQLEFGKNYLLWLNDQFGGDTKKAVQAYNAGVGTVKQDPNAGASYLNKVLSGMPGSATGGGRPMGPSLAEKTAADTAKAIATEKGKTEIETKMKAEQAFPYVKSNTISAVDTINRILNSPSLESLTGMRGMLPALPNTEAFDVQADFDSLTSKNRLEGIDQMRGLGQLSNSEGEAIQKAMSGLKRGMTDKAFVSQLKTLKQRYLAAMNGAAQRAGIEPPSIDSETQISSKRDELRKKHGL